VRIAGKVVRFDEIRGYGFISPESGGGDIFLHANDLEIDKRLVRPGARVEFEVEEGERGKFATAVRLTAPATDNMPFAAASPINGMADGEELSDVLTSAEFNHEITETLLQTVPSLTGEQLLRIRHAFEAVARHHGWLEN
jgi:cold shock CspA family protein